MLSHIKTFAALGWALALLVASRPAVGRELVDGSGRRVDVPAAIERVVTLGAVPVVNSFVFVVGRGAKLVNGLPAFVKPPRDRWQLALAPQLAGAPVVQGGARTPDLETLLALRPDVLLTLDATEADSLTRRGLPALQLAWREPTDIVRNVRLMGELFDARAAAQAYIDYFGATIARVARRLEATPAARRPRVLYCQCRAFLQPHKVADWWIAAAGGISVTAGERLTEEFRYGAEQLLAWDPDLIVAASAEDAEYLRQDPRMAALAAVKAGRVHVVPWGLHTWGHRTIEQPLTVMWAARQFHPQRFADLDIAAETQRFYRELLSYPMTIDQAREMVHAPSR